MKGVTDLIKNDLSVVLNVEIHQRQPETMTDGALGPDLIAVLFEPFMSWSSRTHWFALLVTLGIALVWHWRNNSSLSSAIVRALRSKSSWLDVQLWLGRQLLRVVVGSPVLITAWWLSTHLIRWADATLGQPG